VESRRLWSDIQILELLCCHHRPCHHKQSVKKPLPVSLLGREKSKETRRNTDEKLDDTVLGI
jgi:hypothetical protein